MKELIYMPFILAISMVLTFLLQFIFDTDPFLMTMIISGAIFVMYAQMQAQLKDVIEYLKFKNDKLEKEAKKIKKVYEIPLWSIMETEKIIEKEFNHFKMFKKLINSDFLNLRSVQEKERFETIIHNLLKELMVNNKFLEEYFGMGELKNSEGLKGFNFSLFSKEIKENGVEINDELKKYYGHKILENFAQDEMYFKLGENADFILNILNEMHLRCEIKNINNFYFLLLVMKFKSKQYNQFT